MRRGRLTILLSLLSISVIILSACGPRATGGELLASAEQEDIVVDLPALVIDIDSEGQASVGELSVADVGNMVGQDLSTIAVPADMVDFLVSSNIQHIQIDNTANGLLILVNGSPIPSLAWDGEKLVATAEVLETFGAGIALLDKVLPLITNIGIGAIVRLPVAEGAEPIDLVVTESEAAREAMQAQEEFLAAVGTPPTFQLVVQYAEDGTWTIGNMTQQEWSQLAPIPLEMLQLPPDTIAAASAAGIEEIGFATDKDGIFISINGKTLPYITWADGRIQHLLDLAEQMGLLDSIMGPNPDMAAIMDTVMSLLPAVQATNVSLKVQFP